jgi:hypothetical protein
MDAKTGILLFLILLFVSATAYTFSAVSSASASGDIRAEMSKAITNIMIVDTVLIMILGGAAYFYMAVDDSVERPYITVMLHVSLLLSIIAVSISSLQQMNSMAPKA